MLDENDDSLKDRLQNFRDDPDDRVWDRIGARIESDGQAKKLLENYQELPDETLWSAINKTMADQNIAVSFDVAANAVTVFALLIFLLLIYPTGDVKRNSVPSAATAAVQTDSVTKEKEPAFAKKQKEEHPSAEVKQGQRDTSQRVSTNKLLVDSVKKTTADNALTIQNKIDYNRTETEKTSNKQDRRGAGNKSKSSKTTPVVKYDSVEVNEVSGDAPVTEVDDVKTDRLHENAVAETAQAKDKELAGSTSVKNPDDGFGVDVVNVKSDSLKTTLQKEKSAGEKKAAANEKQKKISRHGSGFYFLAMPTFGYQQIDPVKEDNILVQSIQKVSAFSMNRLGIRAELGWEKKLSDRFSVVVGGLYYQRRQTIEYSFTTSSQPDLTVESTPYTYTVQASSKTGTFEYELKNIGILSGINYEIVGDHVKHKVGAGVEFHKALAEPNGANGNNSYLFGNLYYRASYRLSKRIDFIVQPTFNYSFNLTEHLTAPFYVKPYGLGLSFGAYFKLGSDD